MKKSYVVVMNTKEQGAELMHAEPTAEFLREHLGEGVTFQMIRLQPGIELYLDEDGRLKGLPPRCVALWKKWPNMPPVPQIIRGPAVFVMRHAKTGQKAIEKALLAVQFEFPVKTDEGHQEGAQGPIH